VFAELYAAMSARTGHVPEPPDFFARLGAHAVPAGHLRLLMARIGSEPAPAAAVLLSTVGRTAIYLWGASNPTAAGAGANDRLQWEAIRWARGAGFLTYDLGGVTPGAAPGSKKAGIERFKRQFGGQLVTLPGTHTLVLDPWAAGAAAGVRRLLARLRSARASRSPEE
jgi:lipid II:glycine glycyltransferase (peptidoglycan interpeptide bridge formation enzyme)